ncbi:phosphoribulokinase/uridine kinase [Immersiella caudata]|uniref:Phosphoribulokinase/uridine kinase n=1 Tax=Immersiella caudata TaxID=314043 RepID=A0AA40C687_9PEZI|nr:phosphoribulokinase/uridine kinase [Immersiella caudata]
MDGYHLTRAQLSAMPDPVTAQARRGAEFTFDGAGFLQLVEALRQPLTSSSEIIYAPSFDHAVKDPKEGDIPVGVQQRVVVFEGNCRFSYISVLRGSTNKEDVLLDKEPWFKAAALMDLRWFVEVDTEVARVRLARRHLAAGIVGSLEEGDRRAVENDLPNGEEVIRRRVEGIDEVVKSVEDGGWVHP